MALCLLMMGNAGVASSSDMKSGHAPNVRMLGSNVGTFASVTIPSASRPDLDLRIMPTLASLDRARFFEDTDEDIYHENTKSVMHAFGLALLPTLFYKPLSIALAWHYCDTKENKRWVAFFTAVPTAGFGSFYGEWEWAGVIATVGDLAGSVLMSWYFYDEHQVRNQPGGSQTKLWAGLGVSMFFWVFDMVMGPVAAMQFNSNLRKRYLRKSEAPRTRIYDVPPEPETGMADIGPQPVDRKPFVVGYSGRF